MYDFQIEIKNSIDIEEYIYTKNDQKEIFEKYGNFFVSTRLDLNVTW